MRMVSIVITVVVRRCGASCLMERNLTPPAPLHAIGRASSKSVLAGMTGEMTGGTDEIR